MADSGDSGGDRLLTVEDVASRLDVTPEMITATQTTGGSRPERWMLVEVEEAYIHCSKHVPLLQKLRKDIHWGTDDEHDKGGDAFKAKACPRPWDKDSTKQG